MNQLITDPVWIHRMKAAKTLHPEIVQTHIKGERLPNPLSALFRSEPEGLYPLRGTLLRLDEQYLPIGASILYMLLLDEGLLGIEVEIPVDDPAEVHLTYWEERVLYGLLEKLDLQSLNVPHVAIVCLEGDKDAFLAPTAQAAVEYLRERALDWESSVHPDLDRRTATIEELSAIYADGRDPSLNWVGIATLPLTVFPGMEQWLILFQGLRALLQAQARLRNTIKSSDDCSGLQALGEAEASLLALLQSAGIAQAGIEQGSTRTKDRWVSSARDLIGVQTGLLQTRDGLAALQQSAPSVVLLLDEQLHLLQVLSAINHGSIQKNTQPTQPQVIQTISLLCEAVRQWIAIADG